MKLPATQPPLDPEPQPLPLTRDQLIDDILGKKPSPPEPPKIIHPPLTFWQWLDPWFRWHTFWFFIWMDTGVSSWPVFFVGVHVVLAVLLCLVIYAIS